MTTDSRSSRPPAQRGAFLTTRWTRVCLAKADSENGREALADLCDAYYKPVVTFLNCELKNLDAAREMSHAFFAEMLEGGTIRAAIPERGRFRSYLLGAVKHFLSHQREASLRIKRGGGFNHLSLNDPDAAVGSTTQSPTLAPDLAFDRQWALTTLARAMETLRQECQDQGRLDFFEKVKPWLTGEANHGDQASVATLCGMTPDAFKMATHRLKRSFRHCVREEIAGTLGDPAMVDAEMQALLMALKD